jgi:hypothetical protein
VVKRAECGGLIRWLAPAEVLSDGRDTNLVDGTSVYIRLIGVSSGWLVWDELYMLPSLLS